MKLTDKELLILKDTDFLLSKAAVLKKINRLLEHTREELKICVATSDFSYHINIVLLIGVSIAQDQ